MKFGIVSTHLANKNLNNFNVILLTYPKIVHSKSQPTNEGSLAK